MIFAPQILTLSIQTACSAIYAIGVAEDVDINDAALPVLLVDLAPRCTGNTSTRRVAVQDYPGG